MANPVVHWELMSKEPARVANFYAKIFGRKVNHVPESTIASSIPADDLARYRSKFSLFTDPRA